MGHLGVYTKIPRYGSSIYVNLSLNRFGFIVQKRKWGASLRLYWLGAWRCLHVDPGLSWKYHTLECLGITYYWKLTYQFWFLVRQEHLASNYLWRFVVLVFTSKTNDISNRKLWLLLHWFAGFFILRVNLVPGFS